MAPYPLQEILGVWGSNLVYLFIGISFGAVLEMAGFANSPKLAAQFYFKDQTVLKVMFTAIVVAMVLLFWASGLERLDYVHIWVNPTYLWPGIVGGLIMGFGFIIGGFCPGTSLVALATFKIDGIFFALGAVTGIFFFGETVSSFTGFWNSSFLGRLTLPEWLGLSTGVVVVAIVLMAVFMFWGAERLEEIFDGKKPVRSGNNRNAATILVVAALGLLAIGQPSTADRWNWIAEEKQPLLDNREVQIHPAELLQLMNDSQLNLVTIDLRDEANYNLFHLKDVQLVKADQLEQKAAVYLEEPANSVFVLMSDDEGRSTEGWKTLAAHAIPNIYILEGGVNKWLDVFGHEGHDNCPQAAAASQGSETMRHVFNAAIGDMHPQAEPDAEHQPKDLTFQPKVKLQKKVKKNQGGCG